MKSIKIDEIKGFEDFQGYTITDRGEVYSHFKSKFDEKTGRVSGRSIDYKQYRKLKGSLDSKGYPYIDITSKSGVRKCPKVHRLVGLAFVKNIENKPQINHIDGDKTNNNVKNLEWVTNSENQLHAYRLGLNKKTTGKDTYQWDGSHYTCQPVNQFSLDGKFLKTFKSIGIASRETGILRSGISNALRSKSGVAGGYTWNKASKVQRLVERRTSQA